MRGIRLLPILLSALIFGCASEMGRGSGKSLYSVADVLEVHPEDAGKSIQLTLNQKLFFNFEVNPEETGQWSLENYDRRVLLLLSDTPRVASGGWGVLLQARALGYGDVTLKFTPEDEGKPPRTVVFDISIRK